MGYLPGSFQDFVETRSWIGLPGGFGTSLQLQGYELKPEAWSGEANLRRPDLLEKTHQAFHDQGVDIHTTNTYRTGRIFMERAAARPDFPAEEILRDCRKEGIKLEFRDLAAELSYWATKRAVDAALAIQANSDRTVWVGGSFGPLNDDHSHDPATALPLKVLRENHYKHAALLGELGVEILCAETIPTLDEAIAMSEAAGATGLPFTTSFSLDPKTGNLWDGTAIERAVEETHVGNRVAVMFNCTPVHVIGPALDRLLDCYDGPVGAYPNGGGKPATDNCGWDHDESPEAVGRFTGLLLDWRNKDSRVKFLGGCCGASPTYIKALNDALGEAAEIAHPGREWLTTFNHAACDCPPVRGGFVAEAGPGFTG